jgi:hypothetical protein
MAAVTAMISPATPHAVRTKGRARLVVWTRVLEALAEQREALAHRIWLEDAEDTLLEADTQTFTELVRALDDFRSVA